MAIEALQPNIKSYKESFPVTKEQYEKAVRSLLIARFAQNNTLQLSEVSEADAERYTYRINQEFGKDTATMQKMREGDLKYKVVVPDIDYDLHGSILDPDTNEIIPFPEDSQSAAA